MIIHELMNNPVKETTLNLSIRHRVVLTLR